MRWVSVVAASSLFVAPALAGAADEPYDDHVQLGGFFGPRIFSDDGRLGYDYEQPHHPDLVSSIGLGVRVARPFFVEWLLPEAELVVVPTKTTMEAGVDTNVVWLEPRVHLRIDLLPRRPVEPFLVL